MKLQYLYCFFGVNFAQHATLRPNAKPKQLKNTMDEVKDMDIVDAQHADIKQVDEAKEDEIVEDELKLAFDDVEELVNEDEKIPEYEKILTSSRADDNASKIKEQCIYR